MARIVLIHGAFNELWGPNEIASRWRPAVRDGLWHHGVSIADDDIAVCFYGDLFRRVPGDPDEASYQQQRVGIADLLEQTMGAHGLDALSAAAGEATYERTIDLVTTIATRADLRSQIAARVDAVVGDDTKVIVGHSLGSVVAYLTLLQRPQWTCDLVTLGSPLGAPMVLETLPAQPVEAGTWPGSARHWTNVASVGDPATVEPALANIFGDRVEDHLIDNGHRAHAPEPYLNATVTGAAIARALAG
jgi:pimeloyl-ACP methyl ester carboxylesterase